MEGRNDQSTDRLDRIESKIDKLSEIQVQIQLDVAEHIRRTAIAEENIEKLSEALQPVRKHVTVVETVIVALAWIIGIVASIATVYSAVK